ncbi:MAG: ABC transporter permease [Pyrobaculum sp.]
MHHVVMLAAGDFKARYVRYLLATLAITVGVALTIALTAVSDATKLYVEQMLYRVYPADLMIYSESINIPTQLVESIRQTPQVENAEGIIIMTGIYNGTIVSIIGVPLREIDYFAIDLREGRLPIAPGEAVVEESLAVRPGEVLSIKVYLGYGGEKTLRVKVVGVMRSFLKGFVGAFRLNLVVVPLDWLQDSLGTGPFVNAILITMKDKSDAVAFYYVLKDTYREAQIYTQESLLETVSQVFNALNTVFSIISGTALTAAALTIFSVMSITARERLREFGLLKAIGISAREIVLSVVLEVLIIALTGGLIGLLVGFYGAQIVRDILTSMGISFNIPIYFKQSYIAQGLGISLAVALIGSLAPLYRLAKLRPLEVLQLWR